MKILACNSNRELAEAISSYIGVFQGQAFSAVLNTRIALNTGPWHGVFQLSLVIVSLLILGSQNDEIFTLNFGVVLMV